MVEITTTPASAERWDDVQAALTGGGDGRSCQCMWSVLNNAQWNETTADDRARMLHDEVKQTPTPGLVAYVDGAAAGWVRVGPRVRQPRVGRMRIVKTGSAEGLDDDAVWAVTCFSIRREHRGQGVGRELLRAAIRFARDDGARVLEAYPIDTAATKASSNALFVGTLSTFLAAGFDLVSHPTSSRAVVSLTL